MNFQVSDMSCGACKSAIESAIQAEGGRAQVDLEQRMVRVEGLDPLKAEAVIRAAGFSCEPA